MRAAKRNSISSCRSLRRQATPDRLSFKIKQLTLRRSSPSLFSGSLIKWVRERTCVVDSETVMSILPSAIQINVFPEFLTISVRSTVAQCSTARHKYRRIALYLESFNEIAKHRQNESGEKTEWPAIALCAISFPV